MVLTKSQVLKLKKAHKKAVLAEIKERLAAEKLKQIIVEFTGVDGYVDHLAGDGYGFTPASNNDTHIIMDDLIELAENGEDITEALILKHLVI